MSFPDFVYGINMTTQAERRDFLGAGLALGAAAVAATAAAQAPAPLPPKLSTHALDTFTGKQAAGIRIDLFAIDGEKRTLIKTVRAGPDGRVAGNLLEGAEMKVGRYELLFHVADYYRAAKVAQSSPEFLDVVPVRVALFDAGQRYHVPLYFSPWSYMTYRGS
jgi:5-hydroxyisourate hydrolase